VQNWHRPLGPNQKKSRYLKKKDLDPLLDEKNEPQDVVPDFTFGFRGDVISGDEFWTLFDPTKTRLTFNEKEGSGLHVHVSRSESTEQFKNNKAWYLFQSWLEDLAAPNDLEVVLREQVGPLSASTYPDNVDQESPERVDEIDDLLLQRLYIDDDLAAHANRLRAQISEAVGDGASLIILREGLPSSYNQKLLEHVILFSTFWIRDPLSWSEKSKLSLLEHLFCIYKVPKFLLSEWYQREDYVRYKWIAWFILMGQGVSLYKAGKKLDWVIPKGFPHFLYQVPEDLSPTLSIVYAEILRLRSSEEVFGRIIQHRFFVQDLTDPKLDETSRSFWVDTVLWLTKYVDEISVEDSLDLLRWGVFCYWDQIDNNQESFKWAGRSLQQSLQRAKQYNDGLTQRWKNHGWDWSWTDAKGTVWKIVELTSERELYKEGANMRHCVLTYASDCIEGESAIFSMTRNGKRRLTVDINPEGKIIEEARGKTNRETSKEERAILRLWTCQLKYDDEVHIIAVSKNKAVLMGPEHLLSDMLVVLNFAVENYEKTELDVVLSAPEGSYDKRQSVKRCLDLVSTEEGRKTLSKDDIRILKVVHDHLLVEVQNGWIKFDLLTPSRLAIINSHLKSVDRDRTFETFNSSSYYY